MAFAEDQLVLAVAVEVDDEDRHAGGAAEVEVRVPDPLDALDGIARAEVGAQMYNQAINTVMVAKFTQGNEKLDNVIKWAANELEGTLRA